jgi:hypothetical protein
MILAYYPRPGECATIYAEGMVFHPTGLLNTPSALSFFSFIFARCSFDLHFVVHLQSLHLRKKMHSSLVILSLAASVQAHIAAWNPGMYCKVSQL